MITSHHQDPACVPKVYIWDYVRRSIWKLLTLQPGLHPSSIKHIPPSTHSLLTSILFPQTMTFLFPIFLSVYYLYTPHFRPHAHLPSHPPKKTYIHSSSSTRNSTWPFDLTACVDPAQSLSLLIYALRQTVWRLSVRQSWCDQSHVTHKHTLVQTDV